MNSWERRADETAAAYEAFCEFLQLRSYKKVIKKLKKSGTLIYRWGKIYNWSERLRDFDNAMVEELREKIKSEISKVFERQWDGNNRLLEKTFKALERRDLEKASFRTLNEILRTTFNEQVGIMERLEAKEDGELTIQIERAVGRNEEEDDDQPCV